MKCKFDKVGLEGIAIIIEISSPTQKVKQKVNCPKPNMIYKFDFEVYFFHWNLNYDYVLNNFSEFYFATIIILSLK